MTKYEKPAVWETKKISSKVNFFSKRFHKLITELEFGADSSLYSISHSAVINLYNSPTFDGMNELQITHELMPITRHKSVAG
ncbi:hypothetical protein [Christiangramia portivictoriae]|uniref:hypothetical protein n=1 Tax=Christiangramia portivictoriae TaxID=326069 RepID=UPI00042143DF|nr:hypothetical protein [Christiangramia portivictoriae]